MPSVKIQCSFGLLFREVLSYPSSSHSSIFPAAWSATSLSNPTVQSELHTITFQERRRTWKRSDRHILHSQQYSLQFLMETNFTNLNFNGPKSWRRRIWTVFHSTIYRMSNLPAQILGPRKSSPLSVQSFNTIVMEENLLYPSTFPFWVPDPTFQSSFSPVILMESTLWTGSSLSQQTTISLPLIPSSVSGAE